MKKNIAGIWLGVGWVLAFGCGKSVEPQGERIEEATKAVTKPASAQAATPEVVPEALRKRWVTEYDQADDRGDGSSRIKLSIDLRQKDRTVELDWTHGLGEQKITAHAQVVGPFEVKGDQLIEHPGKLENFWFAGFGANEADPGYAQTQETLQKQANEGAARAMTSRIVSVDEQSLVLERDGRAMTFRASP